MTEISEAIRCFAEEPDAGHRMRALKHREIVRSATCTVLCDDVEGRSRSSAQATSNRGSVAARENRIALEPRILNWMIQVVVKTAAFVAANRAFDDEVGDERDVS